jgi:hypothetical protein
MFTGSLTPLYLSVSELIVTDVTAHKKWKRDLLNGGRHDDVLIKENIQHTHTHNRTLTLTCNRRRTTGNLLYYIHDIVVVVAMVMRFGDKREMDGCS